MLGGIHNSVMLMSGNVGEENIWDLGRWHIPCSTRISKSHLLHSIYKKEEAGKHDCTSR